MSIDITSAPQPREVDPRTQALAETYNLTPYQSKPFAQSSPEQMWVMASLFGLTPPDVATARVLEIGCSSGGNLMPLAMRFPQMQCVGVDLSEVQIAHGRALAQALDVRNCDLRVQDIAHATDSLEGPFDYIICHGVFSWVPPNVRDAILNVVRDKLSPHGVAYISYNVYPGWKMREVVRDMMMFHAGGFHDPVQRLSQGKAILDFTKNLSAEQTTYGRLLREEASLVGQAEDYYLLHEYLELENHPMYFRDFMKLACERQLAYLGEAHLADMAPQRLGAEVYQTLTRLSQGNILATEQYMDIFTNRTFRQTLLVHEAQTPKLSRNLHGGALHAFGFSTQIVRDGAPIYQVGQAPQIRYKDNRGRQITAAAGFSTAMLDVLIAAQPHPLAFADLSARVVDALKQSGAQTDAEAVDRALGTELLNLLVQSVVKLHPSGPAFVPDLQRPRAFALAREQAKRRVGWATSLTHNPVTVSPAHAVVLELLDGNLDRAQLATRVFEALKSGALKAQQNGQPIQDEGQLRALATQFLDQALNDFKQLALLH